MHSIVTVTAAAGSYDLTTLAAVKAELGITGTTEDAQITSWITQASKAAATYCNRVFAQEPVSETFRNNHRQPFDAIVLARNPVSAVASITEDDTALVRDTDYDLDPATGVAYRIGTNGNTRQWRFSKLVAAYTAGYPANAIPENIGRAIVSLTKLLRSSATRDPALRSENILSGLYSYTLFNPNSDYPNGLPADVEALLAPYRNIL